MVWKKIAEKNSIEKGRGKEFKIEDRRIAIFNQDGYHALDALCVHQDGSIAPGKLEGDIESVPYTFGTITSKQASFLTISEMSSYKHTKSKSERMASMLTSKPSTTFMPTIY